MTENQLKIKAVIGFSGGVRDSLAYTPCGRYLVYPLGAFVVIKSTRCAFGMSVVVQPFNGGGCSGGGNRSSHPSFPFRSPP